MAVSPDGQTVFVTGISSSAASGGGDFATIAYDASTGMQRWASFYDNNGQYDQAVAMAVSPSGDAVYVTGYSDDGSLEGDYETVAYNAATGAQLWGSRYNGSGNGDDHATALTVSPNGKAVFVAGGSPGPAGDKDYATIAYSAATGSQLWTDRYDGPGRVQDVARAIAVSPDSKTVFVTGGSNGRDTGVDYATVAYDAATGTRLWAHRYNFANRTDIARDVTVSPDGKTVFVTGQSQSAHTSYDYATVAYNAATGAQLWASRYNDRSSGWDAASSVAVGPRGGTVFVTGTSMGATSGLDFATVGYAAATGRQLWVSRNDSTKHCADYASAVAVGPSGKTVFVAGYSNNGVEFCPSGYAVVAYDAATGTQRWISQAGPPRSTAYALAVSPSGNSVYIAGTLFGSDHNYDMLAAAFRN